MNETIAPHGATWEIPSPSTSTLRKSAGRALFAVATIGFVVVALIQFFQAIGATSRGFANWRPVVYAYLVWAVALGIALVLVRGERGHRALFVLPAVLFTVAMVIFPTVFGLYVSLTDWNLSSTQGRHFVGLDNYAALFHDHYFWNAILNMVYYVLSVLVQYAIAFSLAMLLNADIRARKFFRVAFLLPFMLSPVAVSWMIGRSIMDLRFGPAATVARHLGWSTPAFFASPWPARLSIMALDSWVTIPFMMVLLLAGLQALPGEVIESSKVDGATGWKSFWEMTFPLMLPVSVTAVIIRVIFELKLADIVLTMTGGGPGGATDTVTSFIYRVYNDRSNVGYGTAMAQFYLVVIIIFITAVLALAGRWMRRLT